MVLSGRTRGWLIWAGVICLIVALRVGCLVYERSRPFPQKKVTQKHPDEDQLVVVPKFHMDDYASTRQLIGRTLWIKLGYSTEYFPISEGGQARITVRHLFLPLEKFVVDEVVESSLSRYEKGKQVLLLFQKEDKRYGTVAGFYHAAQESYDMQLDELFYLKDPHELYDHWNSDDWLTIERHQLAPGMTLTQVFFSLGLGRLVMTEAGGISLYEFARHPGGGPGRTRVRFQESRVKKFEVLD